MLRVYRLFFALWHINSNLWPVLWTITGLLWYSIMLPRSLWPSCYRVGPARLAIWSAQDHIQWEGRKASLSLLSHSGVWFILQFSQCGLWEQWEEGRMHCKTFVSLSCSFSPLRKWVCAKVKLMYMINSLNNFSKGKNKYTKKSLDSNKFTSMRLRCPLVNFPLCKFAHSWVWHVGFRV